MYRVELKGWPTAETYPPWRRVPNVPCGVERSEFLPPLPVEAEKLFLMYRVELKAGLVISGFPFTNAIPNVPCGVESPASLCHNYSKSNVPNVPCGVERLYNTPYYQASPWFLMYRVELKVQ